MITFVVERRVSSPPKFLIDQIWSGAEWRASRSGIKGLAIEYDDGHHQSMQVCIDWKPRDLALSIMRFRDSALRISFFYSRLPHGIVKQAGIWEAYSVNKGCHLKLTRSLEMRRGKAEDTASFHAREGAYSTLLQEYQGLMLDAVATHLGL